LRELAEAKRKGKTFTEKNVPRRAPFLDKMEALKESLVKQSTLANEELLQTKICRLPRPLRRLAS
jgi:hypothetical protein